MALEMNTTLPSGISIANAYIRVENVELLDKSNIRFEAKYRVNSSSGVVHKTTFSCPYVLSGDNPIQQAYVYLKTLDKFATAEDV